MSVRVDVVCVNADGNEQRRTVLTFEERESLAMETLARLYPSSGIAKSLS